MPTTVRIPLLDELLKPIASSLNDEAARKLVRLKASRKARARIAELAEKCNEGELTTEERQEYETYVLVGEIVAILRAQSRARLARRRQPA